MLFCTIAVGYLLDSKKALTYFFLALAVGCRPFSAIYIIAAFLFFALKDMGKPWKEILLKNLQPLIPMILIAIIYMSYNYVRFNNPLEFGHNYLPEFTRIEDDNYGQFSINYLWNNIKTLLSMKLPFDEKPDMIINSPFMFFIANPIFLVCIYDGVIKIIKYKKISLSRFIFSIAMIINFICICLHKTLGGWQFGARYTCDLMAFAFLDLFLYRNKNTIENNSTKKLILKDESIGIISLNKFEIALIIFGIIFNVYGAIELWLSV